MSLPLDERQISAHDAARLAVLIDARVLTHPAERDDLDDLADVLANARHVAADEVPADVATLGREVRVVLRRGDRATVSTVTLVEPHEATPASGRISVVSPLGRSLIGLRPGMRARVALPDVGQAEVVVEGVEATPRQDAEAGRS